MEKLADAIGTQVVWVEETYAVRDKFAEPIFWMKARRGRGAKLFSAALTDNVSEARKLPASFNQPDAGCCISATTPEKAAQQFLARLAGSLALAHGGKPAWVVSAFGSVEVR